MTTEPVYAYIAIRHCGCCTGAVVDRPKRANATAREIAGYIRRGYAVERVAVEVARDRLGYCPHVEGQKV